ncbi:hypothetical protein CHS0354_041931 [Potamilus streckersoni]|uniref:Uncharacterized protein n=1 Tax=Potamilus streckersoni TaxID=2493646 RepID=A0AAE0ST92_9BIVA|nr:hypothetical protein CHS0354_041931 [Potamilus streckersoni]
MQIILGLLNYKVTFEGSGEGCKILKTDCICKMYIYRHLPLSTQNMECPGTSIMTLCFHVKFFICLCSIIRVPVKKLKMQVFCILLWLANIGTKYSEALCNCKQCGP